MECRLLEKVLTQVAHKFKAVKFTKIVSTSAVENWPDYNLPTLFVYHEGELKTQTLGIKKLGGRSITPAGKLSRGVYTECAPIIYRSQKI